MITRIKGTQDFLDLGLYSWVVDRLKKHFTTYHFTEIATPLIEPLELFVRSLGTETDVVSKEMYQVVTEHESSSEKICLRPEITASIMRAFVNAGIQQTPWKVFSIGPAFRHERPQKGRYRQFHQISIEAIGSSAVAQDALFITMLDNLFKNVLQLQGYALLINYLGTREDRLEHKAQLKAFLTQHRSALCELCQKRMETNILRVFDCKQQPCQELYKNAPKIIDVLSEQSQLEWQLLKDTLEELSVSFSVKPTLVRGLDYYNKTVFEFVSVDAGGLGSQNTFCGGGRYDSLATQIGASHDYPSIGAAIGIERLLMLLQAQQLLVPVDQLPALTVVIPFAAAQTKLGLQIVEMLHAHNRCADILLEGGSIKSMFKTADRLKARHVVLLGDKEQAEGTATIKNMMTGLEVYVPQRDILSHL